MFDIVRVLHVINSESNTVSQTINSLKAINFSRLVLALFKNAKKKLNIVRNGDHSLSNPRQLKIILKELNYIVKDFT